MSTEFWNWFVNSAVLIHNSLCDSHWHFNCESYFIWNFNELANETEVGSTFWNWCWSIWDHAWLHHRYDVWHNAWQTVYVFHKLWWNTAVSAQFLEDFLTGTILHSLLHVITDFVDVEAITPKNVDILWLSSEVWLVWDNDAHKPVGINETHQGASSRSVLLEIGEHLE